MTSSRPVSDASTDLEAHLRALPPKATCRGMFFRDVVDLVEKTTGKTDVLAEAGLDPQQKYVQFFEYPYADFLRVLVAAARILHPGRHLADGLRDLGTHAYDTLLSSHPGRVIFGVLGKDIERILLVGPKGYKLALNFGDVVPSRVAERHVRYEYARMPAFLATYQRGVVEGVLAHCKVDGTVDVESTRIDHAVFQVRWR